MNLSDAQIDIPLLYVDLTEEAIQNAYKFYELWYEAPGAIKVCYPLQQVRNRRTDV